MPSGLTSLIRKYGFAAVAVAVLGLMAIIVLAKSVLPGGDPAAAMAKGPAGAKGGPGGDVVGVEVATVARRTFSDGIQALGTAQARESIVITPKVADTIRVIRFDSGQRVRRGEVLVELSSVEQQADLAEAIAANAAAQEDFQRFDSLFQRGFAPRARYEAARATAQATQARVEAGQSRMADRVIRAPFSGVMGLRTASPGQFVQPGNQIGTLDDISEIKLDFDVPEIQIAMLRSGVAIVARTAAFPDVEFTGHIAQVDSRVSPETRTVRVRAVLPNPAERLRAGMLMTVEVRSNPRDVLAAPEPALMEEGAGASFVYVIAAGEAGTQTAQRREVRTGQRVAGYVEILEGLAEGDQVVVEGVQRVRPDGPVRVGAAARPAQAPPQAAPTAPAAPAQTPGATGLRGSTETAQRPG